VNRSFFTVARSLHAWGGALLALLLFTSSVTGTLLLCFRVLADAQWLSAGIPARQLIGERLSEVRTNKAKLVIHKAYGFRTAANYIRNLYHCLGDLPLPKTVHTFV
jgi:hypothetical protein